MNARSPIFCRRFFCLLRSLRWARTHITREMESGRPRSATALFALIGALSPQPMHAFAARMGSPALLPAYAKNVPSSLLRKPRYSMRHTDRPQHVHGYPATSERRCVQTLRRLGVSVGLRYCPAANGRLLLRLASVAAIVDSKPTRPADAVAHVLTLHVCYPRYILRSMYVPPPVFVSLTRAHMEVLSSRTRGTFGPRNAESSL